MNNMRQLASFIEQDNLTAKQLIDLNLGTAQSVCCMRSDNSQETY